MLEEGVIDADKQFSDEIEHSISDNSYSAQRQKPSPLHRIRP